MNAPATQRHTAEERRQEIIEVAQDLFAERGFYGTSTDEIARRAGISQPYLFHVEAVSGFPSAEVRSFFAIGMLLNVIASMQLMGAKEKWAARLLEGLKHK